jgi:hypothetical protein
VKEERRDDEEDLEDREESCVEDRSDDGVVASLAPESRRVREEMLDDKGTEHEPAGVYVEATPACALCL